MKSIRGKQNSVNYLYNRFFFISYFFSSFWSIFVSFVVFVVGVSFFEISMMRASFLSILSRPIVVLLWLRMGFPKRVCREASLWLVEVKKSSVIRFKFRSESNARELAAETRFKFRVSRVQLERSCDYWLQKRHGRNRTRLFVSRFRFHASNLNAT